VSTRAFVLVTGASGTIGQPLIAMLASMPSIEGIVALGHVAPVIAPGSSVRVVAGDVTQNDNLGLTPANAEAVSSRVTAIIHAAANTRFDAPLPEAWATTVGGTRHVLEFARRCPRLDRLVSLSTTHVAGRRTGTILEDDLEHDAGFVNTYEATKYEAERELRTAMRDLPIAVARISTVTGDSCSGAIARKSAIHQAVRFMYAGLAPMVPGPADSPVDFIALDDAVRAIAFLTTEGFEAGATWHLCAGFDTVPFGELLDLTLQAFLEHRPSWRRRAIEKPALVDLPTFELFCKSVDQVGDSTLRASTAAMSRFAPQLAFPKRFDDRRCHASLAHGGVTRSPSRVVWSRMVKHLIQPENTDLEARILDFVSTSLLGGHPGAIDADTYLFDEGLIDSLKILQLIAFIETEIGRTIPDTDVVMANFRSVRTMAERFDVRT
jgi:nucleoside-diphosphate-sugar epimerase/acyl carrier protein